MTALTSVLQNIFYLFILLIVFILPVYVQQNIRIFHGCEVWIEKSIRGSLFGLVMPNSEPEMTDFFLSAHNSHDIFFFLHTFWYPAFGFNVGVAVIESRSYTLTSAILKVDVVCDVIVTSTSNVLTTELRDFLYNQCIDNMFCYSFFYLSHGSDKGM